MNGECGAIHVIVAFDHFAVVTHQDQVRNAYVAEVHSERIHPEMIGQNRVARGNVAGDSFAETECSEQAERSGEALFAVQALFFE
jgi:hypothetical protein